MKSKIIVTGGAGYIGSHTVIELINAGYEPILVDNFSNSFPFMLDQLEEILGRKVTFYNLDCGEPAFETVFQKEGKIDGVIHFAAYKAVGESVAQPMKYYKNNVGSLINLLGLMEKYDVKNLVFSSSCTVYGEPAVLPVKEDTPSQPANSPYGNTKQICEEIINDLVNSKAPVKAILLRYFNPIGAHTSGLIGELPIGTPNNLIPFITQTAVGIREQVTVFGGDYDTTDGTCIRDYIHVVDLAKAHVKAMAYSAKQTTESFSDVFNLGVGLGSTVLEVINAFEKSTGEKLNYKIGSRRAGDVEKIYADASKSLELLNWKTEISLEESLKDAWNWQVNLKKYEHLFK